MVALLIMVEQYRRGDAQRRAAVARRYLDQLAHVDNWDLVDSSAPYILGPHVAATDDVALLEDLARSEHLWSRRVAVLATFHHIRAGDPAPTLRVAELLVDDGHDLIHKAVGWMLREVGTHCGVEVEEAFLRRHLATMPRTMLRYAIERFPEDRRRAYLAGDV